MPLLATARLLLVPATATALRADLQSPQALAAILKVNLPAAWPPDLFNAAAISWTLDSLESGRFTPDWGSYYITRKAEDGRRPLLIGVGGFKGSPTDGAVELGYEIAPEVRRQGFALEAVEEWTRWAFTHGAVERVLAHTLTTLTPSISVLERAGFAFAGLGNDPDEAEAVQSAISRAEHVARTAPL
ncbi:MAG TPA: GNAT family N-acetyltransferase [Gemmatimonadaceae bacterium]|nr:GNAT family N-acetyltransferase [Gemmatimonadaceae bacterium]